ncbi:MAG: GHKL domain-containing protein [Chlorobi bacterium]|nr:GHKL domain-containing protein [Chlorobiota bacterium]
MSNIVLFTFPFFLTASNTDEFHLNKLYPTAIYTFYLITIVYINYFFLIPRYAAKRKIGKYFLAVSLIVLVNSIFFVITFSIIINIRLSFQNAVSFSVLEIVYVIITSFFKFFKEWVENQGLQLKIAMVEKQKAEAELIALKSQLNPHFLFNVLNSIYSHSMLNPEAAPSIILKLSELMGYILYECKEKLVSLQKEMDFLMNYIELEQIRTEDELDINMDISNTKDILVPPLLFIPLVENAFKHSVSADEQEKTISLKMEVSNDNLLFDLCNTKTESLNAGKKRLNSGIGIENVKKRLNLLYPGMHSLVINETKTTYCIKVKIKKLRQINI